MFRQIEAGGGGGGEGDRVVGSGAVGLVVDGVREVRGRESCSVVDGELVVAMVVREEVSGGKEGGWTASVESYRTPQSPQSVPTWHALYSEPGPPSSQKPSWAKFGAPMHP